MSRRDDDSSPASVEVASCVRVLKAVDIELACLAMLSRDGIKPLSRWEKALDDLALSRLEGLGLCVGRVPRTTLVGTEVVETVFSLAPACVCLYQQQFCGRPVDKSPETVRLEGFLFGYPPCCIEQYVRQPYAPNDLPSSDQRVLFHWACNGCRITPALLPSYRRVYDAVERC